MRGLAHLGVLQVLEEAQIAVDMIAGTSMGGLVAGLYAAGIPLQELISFSTRLSIMELAARDRAWRGLFGHEKMATLLAELLGGRNVTFQDLRIPAAVVAADVESGEMVVLDRGPLIPALMATSAFPLVFAPVRYQDRWLVDGGVINNFPVDVVRHMGAERVLGVRVPPCVKLSLDEEQREDSLSWRALFSFNNRTRDWRLPFLIAESSVGITANLVTQTRLSLYPPDVLIDIEMPNVGVFATDKNTEIVHAGYKAAMRRLSDLVELRTRPLSPWKKGWQRTVRRARRAWAAWCQPDGLLHP
jgi:NTE family protein